MGERAAQLLIDHESNEEDVPYKTVVIIPFLKENQQGVKVSRYYENPL
jgi:hypothetical protein